MGLLSKIFGMKPKVFPTSVNDANFAQEVLKSELPVLVDFWGPGCAPCKMLETVVINLATEYQGRLKVVEINSHEAMKISRRYGVMATPTVLYFKDGGVVERIVGFKGSPYHRQFIEEELLDAEDAA